MVSALCSRFSRDRRASWAISGFRRPRAAQYSPALLPPIHVPGHASFPSGHATEAYLIALCLKEVMPSAACAPAGDVSPLMRMARRIARNREVLGLHFPSDSKAGRHLAEETFKILVECDSIKDSKWRSAES